MNSRVTIGVGVAAVAALFLLLSSVFTVHQTQQALVLQFGNPIRVVREPGLHFKVPFVQQVDYFEKRVLDFDAPSVELVLGDQKRLVVDAFARYRITDALRFRQSVGTETAFRGRLEPIVFSSLRSVLGEAPLFTLLSDDRTQIMNRIKGEANRALAGFGVELVDVRIKRADLPPENSQAIFRRMQTEREREARELRAQGAEIGQRIRARADRERRVLIAEAERESQILRGQGDAEAIGIFAAAFGQDAEFFDFYRSLQAYREALGDGATNFVLSPDSEFFRFFNGQPPEAATQPSGAGADLAAGGSGAGPGTAAAAATAAPVPQPPGTAP
jgi:modulator of FtsH protease HflC